jgi:D-amino-acid dehydrogenase
VPGPRVLVLGSGIAGASTAFALAAGGADVVVVDSVRPGQATAAGAGIIEPWSTSADGPVYDLYAAGAAYYPSLVDRLRELGVADIGYRAAGALVVDVDAARLDEVERRLRRRTAGVPVAGAIQRLDADEARAIFPPLAGDLPAVHVSGGARVDGRLLRAGLLAAAQRLGAVMIASAARLTPRPPDSLAVVTPNGEIGADAVVVACGAWVNGVLAPLGHRLPVEPQRGQLVHLLLDGQDTASWPSLLPLSDHYVVPFDAGRVVVGATRESGSGFDPRVTAEGVRRVLGDALSVAPGLAGASLLETRVGLRPLAPVPFLGPLPGVADLFVNAGFGAAGLTMAPVAGEALAQLMLTGASELDLAPFRPVTADPAP